MSDSNESRRERPRLTYAHSVPLPAVPAANLRRTRSAAAEPRINRNKSWSWAVKNYVKHGTATFFGVDESNEEDNLQRWTERHKRLANRCYGRLKEDSVSPSIYVPSEPLTSASLLRPARKDSVVKMTWDGVAFLTTSLARRRKRHRPPLRSRSYAPSSIADDGALARESLNEPTVPATPVHSTSDVTVDEVFFDTLPTTYTPITTVPLPLLSSSAAVGETWPDGVASDWGPAHPQHAGMQRIRRNVLDKTLDNSNRRQYGIGLVGRLLHRSFRRERITSDVRMQLDDLDDHRPFFTYWVTTIQVLITIISLAVYGFGSVGFEQTRRSGLVLTTSLSLQQVDYSEPDNLWIGPRAADLVHLGAKFVPCMRKDKHVFDEIERDREKERNTACCIRNDNSGCVQSSSSDCSTTISTWKKWTNLNNHGRLSGSVCGQDPSHCRDPPSVAPYDWPDDITKWPICKKKIAQDVRPLDHMACEVIGHPCCIGILGECRITTREYCEFVRGFFHEEAFLCSQVSCLDDVCGMIRFLDPEVPDQVYRLWTSLFLHAGLIHLGITVVVQYFLMRDLEKLAGCVRIGTIYIMSGVAGNFASAIFIPYRAEVGPAGSQFGLLACLFVEVFNSWPLLKHPGRALVKLSGVVLVLFLLGLMPWVDNYAHLVGFVFGFLLSYALLPYVAFGPYDRQRKVILICVCLLLVVVLFAGLVILFYVYPVYECDACKYFNCIPISRNLCANQDINITRGEF